MKKELLLCALFYGVSNCALQHSEHHTPQELDQQATLLRDQIEKVIPDVSPQALQPVTMAILDTFEPRIIFHLCAQLMYQEELPKIACAPLLFGYLPTAYLRLVTDRPSVGQNYSTWMEREQNLHAHQQMSNANLALIVKWCHHRQRPS